MGWFVLKSWRMESRGVSWSIPAKSPGTRADFIGKRGSEADQEILKDAEDAETDIVGMKWRARTRREDIRVFGRVRLGRYYNKIVTNNLCRWKTLHEIC